MAFLRRDPPEPPPSRKPNQRSGGASTPSAPREQAVTRIAKGTTVGGEITGATDLVIEGEVEGHVRLDSRVTVGSSGHVRGRITARAVRIGGKVEGDVAGSERVEVDSTGSLEGDIVAPRVTIAEGAFFKGKVEMGQDVQVPGNRDRGDRPAQRRLDEGRSEATSPARGGTA